MGMGCDGEEERVSESRRSVTSDDEDEECESEEFDVDEEVAVKSRSDESERGCCCCRCRCFCVEFGLRGLYMWRSAMVESEYKVQIYKGGNGV